MGTFENTGGVVSSGSTVTLKPAEPLLPAASVAEQETAVVPIAKTLPEFGVHVTGTLGPSTRSDAVGDVYVTVSPLEFAAATSMLACPLRVGAVVSLTVTLKVAFAVSIPAVAVQVTVVVVIAKTLPEAGTQSTVAGFSVSVALGVA